MFFWDWTIIILIPGLIISFIAQMKVSSTYSKYSSIPAMCGVTGAETAQRILRQNGVYGVSVAQTGGTLSDHYDPRQSVIRLSGGVYSSSSIASIAVAAHEAGHAVQHATGYAPLAVRNALLPVVNLSSSLAIPVFIIGLIFNESVPVLCDIGIFLFAFAVLFQLITLPVELDASRRAMRAIQGEGILSNDEAAGARKMLTAAAMTYVAAMLMSLLQLLRLFAIRDRRR
ncbi:MAG: zinc metallopeptidase [Firmicutes bacterium]|nr:zinc metallopeptidase [Bacillota bacterium]